MRNNGADVINTFYLDHRESSVTHELAGKPEAVLRKGVYETEIYTDSNTNGYVDRQSRLTYANGPATSYLDRRANSLNIYYVTVYNAGSARLYLNDLQDRLPRGFGFGGLYTTPSRSGYSYEGFIGSRTPLIYTEYFTRAYTGRRAHQLVTVEDPSLPKNSSVEYMNAGVRAEASEFDSDGRQHVTFHIESPDDAHSAALDILYDESTKLFYLLPGQAIRFAYGAYVGPQGTTDPVADNGIAMPYYDRYGMGLTISNPGLIRVYQAAGVENNDGGCTEITNPMAEQYGFLTEDLSATTQWLYSAVTQTRRDISPGISKSVGGTSNLPTQTNYQYSAGARYGETYTGAIRTDRLVNWKVQVFNDTDAGEPGGTMMDYVVTDTVDYPYSFMGPIEYYVYNSKGKLIYPTSSYGGAGIVTAVVNRTPQNRNQISTQNNRDYYASTSNVYDLSTHPKKAFRTYYYGGTFDPEGTFEIRQLENGAEQIIIHFTGPGSVIPEGGHMEIRYTTIYNSVGTVLSEQFYNDVLLEPTQSFTAESVSNGAVQYNDSGEPYGIRSGATVAVAIGYSTSAVKHITEVGKETNTARSDDESHNYIVLDDPKKEFYYDLVVNTPDEDHAPFRKLVICDALPQKGDHAAFDPRDTRDTQFLVSLLSDPQFAVSTIADKGSGVVTTLTADQYTIYLSEKTEFTEDDWKGEGEDWFDFSKLSDSEKMTWAAKARSIRLIINDQGTDGAYTLMPPKTQVRLRFKAHIDDAGALPGQYAWNSFGYSCTIDANGNPLTLNATPLKVGVKYPQFPRLAKTLHDNEGAVTEAPRDMTFGFLLYTGSKIVGLENYAAQVSAKTITEKEAVNAIYKTLHDQDRQITYVPLTVKKGEKTAVTDQLEKLFCFNYNEVEGTWTQTEIPWSWANGDTYSVIELPTDPKQCMFESLGNSRSNNYSFQQNGATSTRIMAVNQLTELIPEGEELPSTGGVGTTRYYLLGSILLAAAGICLLYKNKKRMKVEF